MNLDRKRATDEMLAENREEDRKVRYVSDALKRRWLRQLRGSGPEDEGTLYSD